MSDIVKADAGAAEIVERVVMAGDLARLSPEQRVDYYRRVCDSLGLNPLTKPFDYLQLNGKLTLYATRAATDQLRALRGISVEITGREMLGDAGIYVVTARATDRTGRKDEAVGAVSIAGLKGDALANALMKAETKAKRRVTLSLAGLGWLDESEVDAIPGAQRVQPELVEPDPTPPPPKLRSARAPEPETAEPEPTVDGEADVVFESADELIDWLRQASASGMIDALAIGKALGREGFTGGTFTARVRAATESDPKYLQASTWFELAAR